MITLIQFNAMGNAEELNIFLIKYLNIKYL